MRLSEFFRHTQVNQACFLSPVHYLPLMTLRDILDQFTIYFFCLYFKGLFIYLFLAVLALCCCVQCFSSWATLFLGAWASHFGIFSCCGARASVVVACELRSCDLA